ncbi:MAG: cupin domain-containing protein [Paracoccaceae bacterium]
MPHPAPAPDALAAVTGAVAPGPASNLPLPPTGAAFSIDAATTPLEGGTDPTFGTVCWRTLISGGDHADREFVLGIAEFGAHGTLHPHRHSPAEFYLGLSGDGIVTIDGVAHRIATGVAVYIPGEAEHGVLAGPAGLRFAYGFAERAFADVAYRFSALGA